MRCVVCQQNKKITKPIVGYNPNTNLGTVDGAICRDCIVAMDEQMATQINLSRMWR